MPYRWTPPPGFASFELNGKVYRPGDMIPISKDLALHHMRHGHVFEGVGEDLPAPLPSAVPAQQTPAKAD